MFFVYSPRLPIMLSLLAVSLVLSCVPSNPTESVPSDAAQTKSKGGKRSPSRIKPKNKAKPKTTPATSRPTPKRQNGPLLTAPFEDDFERKTLGANWHRLSTAWRIEDGQLCAQGAKNKGIWLRRRLPTNARIEFEATSYSPDGDIKAEFWGDGASGATGVSYSNATSYLIIFGGWKNQLHVLSRLDEHAKNRLEIQVDPSSAHERNKPVVSERVYAFRIEREDGKTVSWWVDGVLMHQLRDPKPLVGDGHDHFGFNDWEVRVCFDNVKITPL